MRAICLAELDKMRPVVVLTRDRALRAMTKVTVAPIMSTIKGLSVEVRVGRENGLDHESVISCDNIATIPASKLGRTIGFLRERQEPALAEAIVNAFDLRIEDLPGA